MRVTRGSVLLLGFFLCREGVLLKVLRGVVELTEGRVMDLKDWRRGVRRRKSGDGVGR